MHRSNSSHPERSEYWLSPAKLNLFLKVLQRRGDGYHDIQSLIVPISWWDELRFKIRHDGKVIRRGQHHYASEAQDLCTQAAHALKEYSGSGLGVDYWVTKRIPVGMGLGGGSSNAATCLHALNQLWCCGLSQSELVALSAHIGSDVPALMYGTAVWVEGRGERVYPLEIASSRYTVVTPNIQTMTAQVYGRWRRRPKPTLATMKDYLQGALGNDLLSAALALNPALKALHQSFVQQHRSVQMSGSGSAFFIPGHHQVRAQCGAPPFSVHRLHSLRRHHYSPCG